MDDRGTVGGSEEVERAVRAERGERDGLRAECDHLTVRVRVAWELNGLSEIDLVPTVTTLCSERIGLAPLALGVRGRVSVSVSTLRSERTNLAPPAPSESAAGSPVSGSTKWMSWPSPRVQSR